LRLAVTVVGLIFNTHAVSLMPLAFMAMLMILSAMPGWRPWAV
jgi:hypothetical protein